ncbi:putative glycosyltransferase [Arthrobacter globiformis NBRC 12137]|uniref:Putative glycosyltransferase n=1 Tax=Arthrobacter globiformis (strain ATCC 8010 / DSM 20124 / JCM 1332 / NBRC 12137 / NCIMB 8907 / NRRL B-2979 / 168) TaxID=1077972 RepID=H0QLN3_ARTG1|nr:glycosyltransferase family 4 protein [Arthrobacter globiformis]GAB13734.1 putative glycosyltransferase [Arthrobacter globiformis NBRC 12137]
MLPLPAIRLLVPANIRHNSGGNVYNAALAQGLEQLGVGVTIQPVDGQWPVGSKEERRRLAGLLGSGTAGGGPAGVPASTITIVDGLVASGAPEAMEAAAAGGQAPWVLLHMPLDEHPDLEARALRAAAGVICTSGSAAAEITRRHGLAGVRAALPGTGRARVAGGSEPPRLLAVAALLPNKDQLTLLGALARLQDLEWTAALVGSATADPEYARQIAAAVDRHGLGGRVQLPGELTGQALEQQWHAADLSLLVSKVEAFGMAVTESVARGVPVIVRAGTGAVEALGLGAETAPGPPEGAPTLPGAVVELGDAGDVDAGDVASGEEEPEPLAALLRSWLTDPALRAEWRRRALAGRERLPGWDATARRVLGYVAPEASQGGHSSQPPADGE